MKHKKVIERIAKWVGWAISGIMLALLLLFLIYHWRTLLDILTSHDPGKAMHEFISGFGIWSMLLLILFQTLQIIIAFLPGEPIELAAGMMYGGFWGAVLCLSGVLIGTYLVFFAVQKLGSGLITAFHDEKKVKKLNRLAVFKYQKNAELMTFILFLIPGLPKDFFTFLAPLAPISIGRFVLISTLGRMPGMLITTYAGVNILEGNLKLAGILYGILAVCALIGIICYRCLVRRETHDEKEQDCTDSENN